MKIEEVKKLSPVARLAYWIEEREWVRIKKECRQEKPWTDDEILQQYRFCNVRRMDDKVSHWLLKNWYKHYFDHPNMLTAVALARFINKPMSLHHITEVVFKSFYDAWPIKTILRGLKKQGPVFNGAYMVRGNSVESEDKIGTVVDEYVGALRRANNTIPVPYPNSMEATHHNISQVYGFGSFMAGQVVADLRWAVSGTWADKMTWAPLGPGSKRGMNRIHGRDLKFNLKQKQFEEELLELMETLKEVVPQTITERLEAMDYQNCLCEYDKYSRVLNDEGKFPKQKYPGLK